jgi:phosphonate transport system substrate-binding protein
MGDMARARLSRRTFLGGTAGAALTAILAACGSSSATNTPVKPTTAPTTGAAATTAPTTGAAAATTAPTTAPTTAATAAATQAPAATTAATPAGTTAASSAASGTTVAGSAASGTTTAQLAEATAAGTATGISVPNLTGKLSFKTLNIAFIPAEDATKVFNDNKELLAYIKQALGIEVKGTVGTSYSAVIEAQRAKKVELAYYGPFSYILAHQVANVQCFLQGQKADGKIASYNSLIITTADSPISTLADIKGKTFSFVDPASTSGHLVPAYTLLQKAGLTDQKDYKSNYAGSHPASYQAVINKKVDAGAIASDIFGQGVAQGTIDKSKVKVIDTSFDIPGSPMGVRADIAAADVDVMLQAFLAINDQKDSALYKNFVLSAPDGKGGFGVGAVKLVKGDDSAYDELRKIPPALGLDLNKLGS